ncbi:DUF5403 family protein [Actinophytocola sp.]|uniref:DUF5403 family protein n=1 Tax=Actinophytocola sp. TaxID=1872138 RepID=UPI003D6A7629
MAEVDRNVADIVAHLPGVRDAVGEAADEIAARARANLAQHRDSGDATIEVIRGRTDAHVSLVDEAALSIEYGHFTDNGETDAQVTYVPGLRILRDAADL